MACFVVGEATVFQLGEDSREVLAGGELQLTTGEHDTTLQVRCPGISTGCTHVRCRHQRKSRSTAALWDRNGASISSPGLHTSLPGVLCAEAVAWKCGAPHMLGLEGEALGTSWVVGGDAGGRRGVASAA